MSFNISKTFKIFNTYLPEESDKKRFSSATLFPLSSSSLMSLEEEKWFGETTTKFFMF